MILSTLTAVGRWADEVLLDLERMVTWPPPEKQVIDEEIGLWIAHREPNRYKDRLKDRAGWTGDERRYMVDPLGGRINRAFASLLFGRPPRITPADEADEDNVTRFEECNRLATKLQRGAVTSSSEGEVWWRIYVNRDIADAPLIEWYSRTAVWPRFAGGELKACAFISRYDTAERLTRVHSSTGVVYRHFEIHDDTSVLNVLFRGEESDLGRLVDLDAVVELEEVDEEWDHNLGGILAGQVINREGVEANRGLSDFEDIEDYLLGLNEAMTIGQENMRLTAKKRVVVPASALDEFGNLPAGKEVLAAEVAAATMGEATGGTASAFRVLEYSFDAESLIRYKQALVEEGLSRVGVNAQFVGAGARGEGLGVSGTSLRIRLIPTVAAGEERGQYWDDELPKMLRMVQLVDELPEADGGFGNDWTDAETPPAIERGSTLPEDEGEIIDRNARAVEAQIKSRRTAIEEQHPDWSEDQVNDELSRILEETGAGPFTFSDTRGSGDGGGGGTVGNDGAVDDTQPVADQPVAA